MITQPDQDVRQQLAADSHRPRYHYQPPSNWMNDPNGIIQWQGQYHLFYQHNPHGPLWGDIHWGHAVSRDLIHWTDLPMALAPTPGSADEAGIFSGCMVNHHGVPTIFYTGTRGARHEIQTQCMATSPDGLLTWEKYAGNPVVSAVPPESGQTANFRDPFVWQDGDAWYMLLGSQIVDVGGAAFLFRSHNLIDWEYLNPLLVGDLKHNGVVWECPNFFKLGDQWVLIISSHTGSATNNVIYFVGSYENYRFTPTYEGVLEYGELYAPLTMLDDQKRRILFGWIREARSATEQERAGWSGVQSIPRVLTLAKNGQLHMEPVPELAALHGKQHHFANLALNGDTALEVNGLALDITAEFQPEASGQCGITFAWSSDSAERTDIVYDAAAQHLTVRTVQPEGSGSSSMRVREVRHELAAGEALQLRILLDGSVIEIIANGRTSLTARAYPVQGTHNQVHVTGTKARLNTLDIWEMPSIWQ